MANVRDLHDKAMLLAQDAMVARHQGDQERAVVLAREALGLEAQAAERVPLHESSEPTRSILYRSAASLAHQSKELQIAQQLIAHGLSGFPPPQIEHELKDLYEQVKFDMYLQERSTVLEEADLEMQVQGQAVGLGVIAYNEFYKRLRRTKELIDRTMQRLSGGEYHARGRPPDALRPFSAAVAAPRPGSFSITFKLLRPESRTISLFVDAAQVVDEIITGIEFLSDFNEAALRDHIGNDSYFTHFLTTTREIAPDEERVSLVGYSSARKSASLTRSRGSIVIEPDLEVGEEEATRPIEVVGILDEATIRKENLIGLTMEDGTTYDVKVREGMDDVVKSYWNELVLVSGLLKGNRIHLSDIQPQQDAI